MPTPPPAADRFHGSAPEAAKAWLLIEHPGPWPAFDLPADLPRSLTEYSAEALKHGVRTQLIRRTDRLGRSGTDEWERSGDGTVENGPEAAEEARRARTDGPWARRPLRVLLAGGPAGSRWLVRLEPPALPELSKVDPARFLDPAPPLPGSREEAALLVCTHGRREVCCARYGRPVARALAAEFGPLVWETTHVGGDEFAANLVVLPAAAYFGRLLPSEAVDLARRALAGDLDVEHYRGTAGQPVPVQAADCLLRRTFGHGAEPAAASAAVTAGWARPV